MIPPAAFGENLVAELNNRPLQEAVRQPATSPAGVPEAGHSPAPVGECSENRFAPQG